MSMKKEHPEQRKTAQTDPGTDLTLRRRRLLKGAAAAPMVLTLFSGAALARTSTTVTVAENMSEATNGLDGDKPKPICIVDGEMTPVASGGNQRFVGPDWRQSPDLPQPPEGVTETEDIFLHYQEECRKHSGVIIVASSATSLTS